MQLWDKEHRRLKNSNGTWKVEVEEKEYIATGRKSETVYTVYQ